METKIVKERIVFYDALRILAIFFVIYNHIDGFHYYLRDCSAGLTQFLYIALSVFTKLAVPLFFMVSGVFLLGKEESVAEILSKRVVRFIIVLVAFSLLTVLVLYIKGDRFSLEQIIRGLLNNELPITVSYNFLYSYIGMLLCLPFLRRIAQGMHKQELVLIICVYLFVSSIIPCIKLLMSYFSLAELKYGWELMKIIGFFCNRTIFYPLIGYWIDKNIKVADFSKQDIILLLLSIVATLIMMSGATIAQRYIIGKYTQDYLGCFVLFTAVPTFLIVKYLFQQKVGICGKEKFKSFLALVGPLTFFVYLTDELTRCILFHRYYRLVARFTCFGNSPFVYSVLWCILSISVLGSVAYILRKNAFVRRFI